MSSVVIKNILDLALDLPEEDRAELAHDLIASLDGAPDPDALQAWETEITQRLGDVESGQARTVSADDALHRIHERLR